MSCERYRNKLVIVNGAASGIGKAAVEGLVRECTSGLSPATPTLGRTTPDPAPDSPTQAPFPIW